MRRWLLFFPVVLLYLCLNTAWTQEMGSIEGTLLMLDDKTPHVAAYVQAVVDGEPIASALSDKNGRYQLTNLKPGIYQVRCYTRNGYIYYGKGRNCRCHSGGRLAASCIHKCLKPY